MRTLAYTSFALGIGLAISGAAKLPDEAATLPSTWWIFAIGSLLAAAGVALWRFADAGGAATAAETKDAGKADPVTLLRSLLQPAAKLENEIDILPANEVERRVDNLLEDFVLPFAEVRRQIIDRFGMSAGAEILVTMAVGERMLNRTWSAAADGHMPEARASYPESVRAFEEAHRLVQRRLTGE